MKQCTRTLVNVTSSACAVLHDLVLGETSEYSTMLTKFSVFTIIIASYLECLVQVFFEKNHTRIKGDRSAKLGDDISIEMKRSLKVKC
jgi:hypothetical protein